MYQHDAAHTGHNPAEATFQPPLRLKWTHTLEGRATRTSSPAIVNGIVVIAAENGFVYGLDAATGRLRWIFIVYGSKVYSSPR